MPDTISIAKHRLLFMTRKIFCTFILSLCTIMGHAQQDRTVQNRPYADLRPLHFGVLLGTHLQDIEFNNVGIQQIINEDGTSNEVLITTDQDRWDAGLTVGVLGEFRLNTNFQFRIAPAMYFGNRHLTFHNFSNLDNEGNPTELRQDMKTAYISTALDLIFAAPRFNNHRPYLMAGINPMINLNGNNDQYVALKKYDTFAEVGVGCDFYLPYFKLRPELKFMFGLTNSYDKKHINSIKDKNMIPYTNSVDKSRSKMIVLTFYFE